MHHRNWNTCCCAAVSSISSQAINASITCVLSIFNRLRKSNGEITVTSVKFYAERKRRRLRRGSEVSRNSSRSASGSIGSYLFITKPFAPHVAWIWKRNIVQGRLKNVASIFSNGSTTQWSRLHPTQFLARVMIATRKALKKSMSKSKVFLNGWSNMGSVEESIEHHHTTIFNITAKRSVLHRTWWPLFIDLCPFALASWIKQETFWCTSSVCSHRMIRKKCGTI